MVATGTMLSAVQPEIVSPELVLVDPRLATDALGRLSDPDDTLARLEQQTRLNSAEPPLPDESVDPGSSADEEVAGVLQRLLVVSRLRRRGAPSPSS
jgi:hypothetical protein